MWHGHAGGLPPVIERIRGRKVAGVDGLLRWLQDGCGLPVAGTGGGERVADQQDMLLTFWVAPVHGQCPVIGVDDDPTRTVLACYLPSE